DLVDEGHTGVLASAGDVRSVARAVIALAEDADERARMGLLAAKKAGDDFDVETMVGRYERLYQQLARRTPTSEGGRESAGQIVALKGPDFGAWMRDMGPDAGLPYRIDALARSDFELHWSDVLFHRPWTWRPVSAAVRPIERLGAPFVQTLANLPVIARSPL